MLIGYLRGCLGDAAATEVHRQALAEAGCEQIVEEQPNAVSDCTHPDLRALLCRLRPGDVLMVPRLRSLGDNLIDVVQHVQSLTAGGVSLRSLDDVFDALPFPSSAGLWWPTPNWMATEPPSAGAVQAAGRPSCPRRRGRRSSTPCCRAAAGLPRWPGATRSAPPLSAACLLPSVRAVRGTTCLGLEQTGWPPVGSWAFCLRPPWTHGSPSWAPPGRARSTRPRGCSNG